MSDEMLIFRFGLQQLLIPEALYLAKQIVAPSQTPGMSAAKGIEPQSQKYLETSLAFLPPVCTLYGQVDQIFISVDAEAPLC